jgi:GGDEF domain-containing protein
VREHGSEEDFVGHMGQEDFVIITTADKVGKIRERIENRISQSREYFYPLRDRDKVREAIEANHLRLSSGVVQYNDKALRDLDDLKNALHKASAPTK